MFNKGARGGMISLDQLKKIIDREFGTPFLKDGHVKAHFVKGKRKTLEIVIGKRDIWLTESGRVIGAGTRL